MAAPTSPRDPSSGMPENASPKGPSPSETNEKLKDIADKTAKLAGRDKEGATNVLAAGSSIPPPSSQLPLAPNVEQAITYVAGGRPLPEFLQILKMPRELMKNFVENLSTRDLRSMEIAIGKVKIDGEHKGQLKLLESIINKAISKSILDGILADHPTWKSQVDTWKDISIEDKIWLLRVCELHLIGVNLPQVKAVYTQDLKNILEILKPQQKEEIEKTLSGIRELSPHPRRGHPSWNKCPDAICLLVNLERLYLNQSKITVPPDVSRNVDLLTLNASGIKKPFDLSHNIKLQFLGMLGCELDTVAGLEQASRSEETLPHVQ